MQTYEDCIKKGLKQQFSITEMIMLSCQIVYVIRSIVKYLK